MNPDIPQEVRIVNAIAEQLFDVWPVSIVMIDLEDRIWRMTVSYTHLTLPTT